LDLTGGGLFHQIQRLFWERQVKRGVFGQVLVIFEGRILGMNRTAHQIRICNLYGGALEG
jgi:hypothetical protein